MLNSYCCFFTLTVMVVGVITTLLIGQLLYVSATYRFKTIFYKLIQMLIGIYQKMLIRPEPNYYNSGFVWH